MITSLYMNKKRRLALIHWKLEQLFAESNVVTDQESEAEEVSEAQDESESDYEKEVVISINLEEKEPPEEIIESEGK